MLKAISDTAWDNLGILVGCLAAGTIVLQILHEWQTAGRSSVSLGFVGGFFLVYLFWFLYGVRFQRRGIWLPNAVAAVLQIVFAAVILLKT
jgi:hypothetical protein